MLADRMAKALNRVVAATTLAKFYTIVPLGRANVPADFASWDGAARGRAAYFLGGVLKQRVFITRGGLVLEGGPNGANLGHIGRKRNTAVAELKSMSLPNLVTPEGPEQDEQPANAAPEGQAYIATARAWLRKGQRVVVSASRLMGKAQANRMAQRMAEVWLGKSEVTGQRDPHVAWDIDRRFDSLFHKDPKLADKAKSVRTVPVDSLISTQGRVDYSRVKEYATAAEGYEPRPARTRNGGKTGLNRPHVVEYGGKLYIYDGHHRVEAARQRGDTSIRVDYHNLGDVEPEGEDVEATAQSWLRKDAPAAGKWLLRAWADPNHGRKAEQAAYAAKRKGVVNGYDQAMPKGGVVKTVTIAKLLPLQDYLDDEGVAEYVANPEAEDRGGSDIPIVFKHEGKLWIRDGHHRIAAAHERGEKYIEVLYYDLDKMPEPGDAESGGDEWAAGDSLAKTAQSWLRKAITDELEFSTEERSRPPYQVLVISAKNTRTGERSGFIGITRKEGDGKAEFRTSDLYVPEKFQRQGIAQALYSVAARVAHDNGGRLRGSNELNVNSQGLRQKMRDTGQMDRDNVVLTAQSWLRKADANPVVFHRPFTEQELREAGRKIAGLPWRSRDSQITVDRATVKAVLAKDSETVTVRLRKGKDMNLSGPEAVSFGLWWTAGDNPGPVEAMKLAEGAGLSKRDSNWRWLETDGGFARREGDYAAHITPDDSDAGWKPGKWGVTVVNLAGQEVDARGGFLTSDEAQVWADFQMRRLNGKPAQGDVLPETATAKKPITGPLTERLAQRAIQRISTPEGMLALRKDDFLPDTNLHDALGFAPLVLAQGGWVELHEAEGGLDVILKWEDGSTRSQYGLTWAKGMDLAKAHGYYLTDPGTHPDAPSLDLKQPRRAPKALPAVLKVVSAEPNGLYNGKHTAQVLVPLEYTEVGGQGERIKAPYQMAITYTVANGMVSSIVPYDLEAVRHIIDADMLLIEWPNVRELERALLAYLKPGKMAVAKTVAMIEAGTYPDLDKATAPAPTAQTIPDDLRQRTYYHGVDDEAKAKAIMAQGKIRPGSDVPDSSKVKGNHWQTPVEGRAYLSADPGYAGIYAVGGDVEGKDMMERRGAGRYGYVFEVKGADLQNIQPDEDSVGEAVSEAIGQYGPFKDKAPAWLLPFAQRNLTAGQYAKIKQGFANVQSMVGKKLVARMSDQQKYDMIRAGAHVAHAGELPVSRAYRVDRTTAPRLSEQPDPTKFFEPVDAADKVGRAIGRATGGRVWIAKAQPAGALPAWVNTAINTNADIGAALIEAYKLVRSQGMPSPEAAAITQWLIAQAKSGWGKQALTSITQLLADGDNLAAAKSMSQLIQQLNQQAPALGTTQAKPAVGEVVTAKQINATVRSWLTKADMEDIVASSSMSWMPGSYDGLFKAAGDDKVDPTETGVFIGLGVPGPVATKLARAVAGAIPEGTDPEPAEKLHVTLCYCGKDDEVPDRSKLADAVQAFASSHGPLKVRIGGHGVFNQDDQRILYAQIDCPGLQEFRQELVDSLTDLKLPDQKKFGFTPHVTLAYLPADAKAPDVKLPTLEFDANSLELWWGEERKQFKLGDDGNSDRDKS